MSDILPRHLACCLQSLILFCCQRFSEMLLLPVSTIECWLPGMLSKNDKVQRSLKCLVERGIVAEHQWSQINFPICCHQFIDLLEVFVDCSNCRFLLDIECGKLTSGFWGQFHCFDNSTVTSLQNSFSRLEMISVGTPYLQIHLVKIAFATVSGVLSEMATNSAYFENELVKLKMYLLLLPEATGAAIMSKCTRWWVFEQTVEGVSRLGEFCLILVFWQVPQFWRNSAMSSSIQGHQYFLVRLNLVLASPLCPLKSAPCSSFKIS